MLFSLALIFLCGLLLGSIASKLNLPKLLGMLLTGILLGPYVLNLIDSSILMISTDLRQIALIIILLRAGLNLETAGLKKVGRPALLLCFIPASFELVGSIVLAPRLLGLSIAEAALLGTVIAAVSPAVIVPKMLKLMESNYGTNKNIPQMILAGASVDDVFVIVLFTSCTGFVKEGTLSWMNLMKIPTSIVLGLLGGVFGGLLLTKLFKLFSIRDSVKVILLLSSAFLYVTLEHSITANIGFSGLLATMGMGITLQQSRSVVAKRLSTKFSKLWVAAEILLFVLVGATVDLNYALTCGVSAILLIFGVLVFRMVGVYCCLLGTNLTKKERIFCMIAYCPKATVQAAIGSIPLTLGFDCGPTILTVAVLSILITAPIGAFTIEHTYPKLLTKDS